MLILFLIVFVNLVGFGLIIPLMPFYVERLGASPELITITLGLYSLAQFVAAPIWGRLSDRYGRRPILIVTTAGLGLSYVVLGVADSLWLLIFSRVFGGAMAGNLAAAYAYVTDITTPDTRARGMGLLGAAFGLGFIFGPVIGGILAGPEVATANYVLPAMAAAGLTLLGLLGTVILLPESLTAETRARLSGQPGLELAERLRLISARRVLTALVVLGFLVTTAWALFETVYALWANRVLSYGPRKIGYTLAYVGVISVLIQGGAIGPLTRRFGERALGLVAILAMALGYLIIALSATLTGILVSMSFLSAGLALFNPSISSLVSMEASETNRGAVMGIYQSSNSLARVVGPMFSGAVFAQLGYAVPFLIGAVFMLPSLWLLWQIRPRPRVATE